MSKTGEKGKYLSPDGSRTLEYLAAFACSLNAFCIGVVIGWISPTLIKLDRPDSPIAITTEESSTLIAVPALGHAMAPFISNPMIDRLGRKTTIFLGGLPLVISWAMISIAKHAWVLIIARFLAGLALGNTLCVSPIYLGEIASADFRGAISSTICVMLNIGILMAYTITPHLSISSTALIFLAIAVIVQVTLWLAPESPYYLVESRRCEDADATLKKLRGKHDVSEELDKIRLSLIDRMSQKTGAGTALKNLFTLKKNLKPLTILCLFVVTHHFGGLVVLVMFAHKIFEDANSVIPKDTASMMIAATKLVSAIIATFMVDKTGRRPLILVAGIIAGLSNLAIGGYFYAKEYMEVDVSDYSAVPLIAAMTLVFAFNTGLVSIQVVLTGELFSADVKAMGACSLAVFGGIIGGISGKMYLIVVEMWHIGHSVPFISFAVIVLASTFIILSLTPETKGKTFAEIQQIFSK